MLRVFHTKKLKEELTFFLVLHRVKHTRDVAQFINKSQDREAGIDKTIMNVMRKML